MFRAPASGKVQRVRGSGEVGSERAEWAAQVVAGAWKDAEPHSRENSANQNWGHSFHLSVSQVKGAGAGLWDGPTWLGGGQRGPLQFCHKHTQLHMDALLYLRGWLRTGPLGPVVTCVLWKLPNLSWRRLSCLCAPKSSV